jgi:hypothetical protein
MGSGTPGPAQRGGFFRVLWRAARQVFHETTGAMFFLLAFSWTNAALRLWRQRLPSWMWATCAGFAIVMIIFGLTSFRAARRVR